MINKYVDSTVKTLMLQMFKTQRNASKCDITDNSKYCLNTPSDTTSLETVTDIL